MSDWTLFGYYLSLRPVSVKIRPLMLETRTETRMSGMPSLSLRPLGSTLHNFGTSTAY